MGCLGRGLLSPLIPVTLEGQPIGLPALERSAVSVELPLSCRGAGGPVGCTCTFGVRPWGGSGGQRRLCLRAVGVDSGAQHLPSSVMRRLHLGVSPLPQRQRLERLFLAGPAQSVHTRASPLSSFNAMDMLGSSKSLQATAMIPAYWPRRPRHQKRPVDKTHIICTVSCTNAVQQQQQQPASSPWIVGCKGGGALAVPRRPQRSPVPLIGSPQLRSPSTPSRPSLRATPEGARCLARSKSPARSSRPALSDVCHPPSRQHHSGMRCRSWAP